MEIISRSLVFFLLNFGALALGGIATSKGVRDWYPTLDIAPWSPPGWFFGIAWTSIMVLLTILCVKTISLSELFSFQTPLVKLYWIHLVLNIAWNFCFFYFRNPLFGLIEIICFAGILFWMSLHFAKPNVWNWLFLLPYNVWIIVATSLNAYIWWKN